MSYTKEEHETQKLHGKRILVVEDYPLMGEILSETLNDYGHASHVLTGKDALERIERNAPDIILLDLNLPDMNGLEVVKFVRRNEKTSRIPVLAMSGNYINYKKCFEVGCNDFIHKPFTLPALLARLSALISASILSSINVVTVLN